MAPIRILITDDHAIVRASIRTLIGSEPGMLVGGEAADGADAVAQTPHSSPTSS
jgi:DNA-binding NarL/FixJ family response regulator